MSAPGSVRLRGGRRAAPGPRDIRRSRRPFVCSSSFATRPDVWSPAVMGVPSSVAAMTAARGVAGGRRDPGPDPWARKPSGTPERVTRGGTEPRTGTGKVNPFP
ncbi:hypothetical protein GCM10018987_16240 [Streptomyces cremeus]